jgi:opacity protein-like surface antigen
LYKKFIFHILLPTLAFANEDPCENLLAVLNRPTVSDSVCVVKPGEVIIEAGFQYEDSYPDSGHFNTLPSAQVRFGLPYSNEFNILPPNYIHQYGENNGYTATIMNFKHQFFNEALFGFSAEAGVTLPTGDADFGSDGWGGTVNGIINYNLTPDFSISLMLGVSSLTVSSNAGGDRYNTVNPDLVFAWQCLENLQVYAEFYGQTKTGPDQSSGFNGDAGLQYLPTDNIELDIEFGQRFSGELGNFARYIGAGGGIRF